MDIAEFQKQILTKSQGLPENALQEIVDFIDFIRVKNFKSYNNINGLLSKLDDDENRHLIEEFVDYEKMYPLDSAADE